MAKAYMMKFVHKDTGKTLYKFGWTIRYDVMERFSRDTSINYGRNPDQYNDWDISVIWSIYCKETEEAKLIEKFFQLMYPKGSFMVENYLGVERHKYSDMSGVTELRYLAPDEIAKATKDGYNLRDFIIGGYK